MAVSCIPQQYLTTMDLGNQHQYANNQEKRYCNTVCLELSSSPCPKPRRSQTQRRIEQLLRESTQRPVVEESHDVAGTGVTTSGLHVYDPHHYTNIQEGIYCNAVYLESSTPPRPGPRRPQTQSQSEQLQQEPTPGPVMEESHQVAEARVTTSGPCVCKSPPWWAAVLIAISLLIVVLLVPATYYFMSTIIAKADIATQPDIATPKLNISAQPRSTTQWPNHNGPYIDCLEAFRHGLTNSGIIMISPDGGPSFKVLCNQQINGGGWTVIQHRTDGKQDFYLNWGAYKMGFGDLRGEFWLGNDLLHRITHGRSQCLLISLQNHTGHKAFATYSQFSIDGDAKQYRLHVSGFTDGIPAAGDSMKQQNGQPFSTHDAEHDTHSSLDCAKFRKGAWWYGGFWCGYSNLNGCWGRAQGSGVWWETWGKWDGPSLTGTTMMVRGS